MTWTSRTWWTVWLGRALWLGMLALFVYVMPWTWTAVGLWFALCVVTVPILGESFSDA